MVGKKSNEKYREQRKVERKKREKRKREIRKGNVKVLEIFREVRNDVAQFADGTPSSVTSMFDVAMGIAKILGCTYERARVMLEKTVDIAIEHGFKEGRSIELKGFGTLWLSEAFYWSTINRKQPTIMREIDINFNASSLLENLFMDESRKVIEHETAQYLRDNVSSPTEYARGIRKRYKVVLRCDGRVHEDSSEDP